MKTSYALISVHNGKLKKRDSTLDYINSIKRLDLLTFKRKREAIIYIQSNLAHSLRPIKVVEETYKVFGSVQHYSLF